MFVTVLTETRIDQKHMYRGLPEHKNVDSIISGLISNM
jgi:hypothetical protein